MKRALVAAALLSLLTAWGCDDGPTEPRTSSSADQALLKKGGNKPPGDEPPPPPITDPVLLFGSDAGGPRRGPGSKAQLGFSMYRMNVEGAFERVFADALEEQVESTDPSFAPDGQQFVFVRDVYEPSRGSFLEQFQVARARLDGSGLTVLREIDLNAGTIRRPRWSPVPLHDGREKIVYLEAARDEAGAWLGEDLFLMNVDGTGRTRLTSHTIASQGTVQVVQAEWSRTADRILAIILDFDSGEFTRRLYTIDCSVACALTDSVDLDLSARLAPNDGFGQIDWARTGDRIVTQVLPGDRGPGDLWVIDISDPLAPAFTQLTHTADLGERNPTWSPDDSEIAFMNYVDGIVRVYLMNADGSGTRAISDDIGNDFGSMDWQR